MTGKKGPALRPLMDPGEISSTVERMAWELKRDYADKDPILVGILKGAAVFLSDLVRAAELPFEVDFLQASSYGAGTRPSGEVRIVRDVTAPVEGRHVVVVEDIMDGGHTAAAVAGHLRVKGAATVRLCVLLLRASRKPRRIEPDYVGTEIGEGFVVGYGMDLAERHRGLKGIYMVEEEGPEGRKN
ncbi:MAG: hypoxanthine phosphoribosyltransferase [Thermodesulfobacteriota bacterium]